MCHCAAYWTGRPRRKPWQAVQHGPWSDQDEAANKGATYTYTAAGRIATRTWGRSLVALPKVTEYSYDNGGRMISTNYSDTTPDVSISYDALGRQTSQSNGLATSTFSYNSGNLEIDAEIITYTLPSQAAFTRVIDRSQDSLDCLLKIFAETAESVSRYS